MQRLEVSGFGTTPIGVVRRQRVKQSILRIQTLSGICCIC